MIPALAKEKSRAGAKAFVRHFIAILNYSWAVGDGAALERVSDGRCLSCRGLADFIDDVYASGGFQEGGAWRLAGTFLVPGRVDGGIVATPAIDVEPGRFKESSDDATKAIKPHRINPEFRILWSSDSWKMRDITS